MMNENYNGVEPEKTGGIEQAPKARSESADSLDASHGDLQRARSESKSSLATKTATDLGQVKFTKTADESAVEIGTSETAFAGMGKEELMKYANDPFWVRLRWSLFVLFWLAWLGMLAAAVTIVVMAPKCPAPKPLEYWQKGVVYSVYVRSFQDSGAEQKGNGNLKGIMGRLDHFVHLGVNMVTLSSIYKEQPLTYASAIEDFTAINPDYGTLPDYKDLIDAAKAKDLKIIMDLVPNHSSSSHQWFNNSVNSVGDYADYYIWQGSGPSRPSNWLNAFGEPAWTLHPTRGQYYYHKYGASQPDLNYRNPKVREEMKNVLRFWLDQGASGFRLLSFPYLYESEDISATNDDTQSLTKNLNETYNFLAEIRDVLQEYEDKDGEHRILLVETEDSDAESVAKYYGDEQTPLADMPVNNKIITDIKKGFSATALRQTVSNYSSKVPSWGWPNWVLGNVDAPRVGSRLDVQLMDGLAMVQQLLPGTPLTYYGEEIGMEDVIIAGQEPGDCSKTPLLASFACNQARTPMQWSSKALNAGFSNSSIGTWLPIGDNLAETNVATEMGDPHSHLNRYRALVALRKQPAIMFGSIGYPDVADAIQDDIFTFTRIRKGAPGYLIILNLGDTDHTVDFSLDQSIGAEAQVVVRSTSNNSTSNANNKVDTKKVDIGAKEGMVLSFVPVFSG